MDYRRQHHLQVKIARIFNTYGPRMHPNDGRVVSNFIIQALAGEPITIFGDGLQTRSFCYVDDLIDGLERLMQSPDHVTGPVNIGNPVECTMLELAQRIIDLGDSRSTIARMARPMDDPERRRPDISLAKSLLGWEPATGLDEGLRRTIAYFKQPHFSIRMFQPPNGIAAEYALHRSRPSGTHH
jgi:UDP-glucuronate decarboxylase